MHPKKSPPPPAAAHDHGTTNLLVADKDGNVVALTTTINTVFGAKMSVPALGIILNDEMDDFAVAPGVPNAYHLEGERANEVRAGKRPLSSMTPIIVTKNGAPVMTTGGSGGPTIISGVLQVALNILAFHLDAASAVNEPRIHEQAAPDVVIVEQAMPAATRRRARADGLQAQGRARARRGRRDHDCAGESSRRGRSAQGRRRCRLLAIASAR